MQDSLRVANAIKEKNGGRAWAPGEVATAVSLGAKSGNFYYLTAASRDFGLTEGSRDTTEISITDLGRRVISPGTSEDAITALREAFFHVDFFRKVFAHYNGNQLPEEPFLSNTLSDTYGLDRSLVPEFVDLFQKNCAFVQYPVGTGAEDETRVITAADGATVIVAKPKGAKSTGKICFVAMPFGERDAAHPDHFFDEVLASLLTPAIVAAGFEVQTAKRQGSDVIQRTIVNDLLDADLVLVDLTEHNPNVLFELGMRLHSRQPTALIRATGTAAIFDVDHMLRVEEYNPNLWPSTVKTDIDVLAAHIRAAWENRESTPTYMDILRS